ncbi:MAG: hypothetical protein R6X10_18940 [Desulfobacterales bacterium]
MDKKHMVDEQTRHSKEVIDVKVNLREGAGFVKGFVGFLTVLKHKESYIKQNIVG